MVNRDHSGMGRAVPGPGLRSAGSTVSWATGGRCLPRQQEGMHRLVRTQVAGVVLGEEDPAGGLGDVELPTYDRLGRTSARSRRTERRRPTRTMREDVPSGAVMAAILAGSTAARRKAPTGGRGLCEGAPPTGLEPVTLRLTVACSAN